MALTRLMLVFLIGWSLPAKKPDACEHLTNTSNIVKCALAQNEGIRAAKLDVALGVENYKAASGFINPEFEGEFLVGSNTETAFEFAIPFTFELGGKRLARRDIARSQKRSYQLHLREAKENLAIKVISWLYQLRQIRDEFRLLKDAQHTFQEQIEQYESVARLDAEREMALTIFRLSTPEIQLHLNEHLNEQNNILGQLAVKLGHPLNLENIELPDFQTNWPGIVVEDLKSAQYALADQLEAEAGGRLGLAKSEAWPDISVGPILAFEGPLDGKRSWDFFGGLTFSMPIPLLNFQQPQIRAAKIEFIKSHIKAHYAKDVETQALKNLHVQYERARLAMKNMLTEDAIWARHEQFHKQIERGMVSAPIVIELHRQIMNYYETRNHHELNLVETFWRIKALEGTLLKELQG